VTLEAVSPIGGAPVGSKPLRIGLRRRLASMTVPRQLLASSAASYAVSFGLMLAYWQPGRGIGATLYLAIVLAAMATGPVAGAAAGALACGLYWAALILGFDRSFGIVFSGPGALHLANFAAVGAIVGYFALQSRRMLGRSLHVLDDLLVIARRDVVTATANASGFEAAAAEQIRDGRPFALLVGSPPEDRKRRRPDEATLRQVAAALNEHAPADAQLARIGSAEFGLLVPSLDAAEAHRIGPALERTLDAAGVRMTFGWAVPGDGSTVLELYSAAAARLYARRAARKEWSATPVTASLVAELHSNRAHG
jgi:hypothetical protein